MGFSFDGDNRLCRAMYDLFRDATSGAPAEALLRVNHSIMELYAVHPHPDKQMAITCFSDWLHIVFRLRRQMLEPGCRLDIGGMLVYAPATEADGKQAAVSGVKVRHGLR